MHFSTLTTLTFTLLSAIAVSALPQNPTFLEVRQTTCTPGQSYCQVCQPHTDGLPPNCEGVCNAEGTAITVTQQCPTVCATTCQFPSCPLICD